MENKFDNVMKNIDFYSLTGATDVEIEEAQWALGTCFAKDYQSYTKKYGAISFDGHEFTGICSSDRLNVVSVTRYERDRNMSIPKEFYVLEQTNIDGIVVWQDSSGRVYESHPSGKLITVGETLLDYVETCIDS